MPRFEDKRPLPFTADQMFDLVADVGRYAEFLPWCVGVRLHKVHSTGLEADLLIGFKSFRETFTSKVKLDRPHHIHVGYIKGPLKYLHNDWRFHPTDAGCVVEFLVDFEFKSAIFQQLAGKWFTDATMKMMNAFEARAHALYEKSESMEIPASTV